LSVVIVIVGGGYRALHPSQDADIYLTLKSDIAGSWTIGCKARKWAPELKEPAQGTKQEFSYSTKTNSYFCRGRGKGV